MKKYDQTWDKLEQALSTISYRREEPPSGRRFHLVRDDDSNHAVLYIFTYNPNTYRPEEMRHTRHEFVVPVATYHQRQWVRWVLERLLSIEAHETVENFFVSTDSCDESCECKACGHTAEKHDGRNSSCAGSAECIPHRFTCTDGHYERLYSPYHGNGWDPYAFWPEGDPSERVKSPGED